MKIKLTILLVLFLCLTGCGKKVENESQEKVLILASFDSSTSLKKEVNRFNQENLDYKIEIKEYVRSEHPQEDGILLLQREIVSGEGPDLIDFGRNYAVSDIVGEYTEDLLEYFGEEEKQDCFENIINAFSYKGKLYALPMGFLMETFVGKKQNLEGYSSWSIEEMLECYQKQENKRILYPGAFKADVLGTLLSGSMDYYIDWESGECYFDGKDFYKVLKFCNQFPQRLEIEEEFSVKQTFLDDKALLLPMSIQTVYDICKVEHIFGNQEISIIGFPTEGICGTMAQPAGSVLAINQNSMYKEEAWEFIQYCLSESCQEELSSGFPIRRSVLEKQLEQAQKIEYETAEDGMQKLVAKHQIIFEGEEPIDIYCITEEQRKCLLYLIEDVEMSSQIETKIYNIFLEEVDAYFIGEKSLEETVDVIQSRVSVYVNEKIR